jgi:hypothetical protein
VSVQPQAGAGDSNTSRPQPDVRLTFASGGWVLALAGFLCLGVLAWALAGPLTGVKERGDGTNAETYGFDLSSCLVDRAALTGSGRPRDFLTPLNHPAILRGLDVEELNSRLRSEQHLKYLVPGDRVVGIVVNGVARAYPVPVLNRHEIVNDEIAGVPIAVTFSPLCDAPVVVERSIRGEAVEFAVSGLLFNGNLVMYERRPETSGGAEPPKEPSLWCQLQARAISGEEAKRGTTLRVVPGVNLTTWADWMARHPDTTVIDADPLRRRQYREISYERYLDSDEMLAAVTPAPIAEEAYGIKSRIIALVKGGESRVYPVEALLQRMEIAGSFEDDFAGEMLRFSRAAQPAGSSRGHVFVEVVSRRSARTGILPSSGNHADGVADAEPDSKEIEVYPCLWFAWQRVRDGG